MNARRRSLFAALLLPALAAGLAACGGPTDHEIRFSQRAAQVCATRAGVDVTRTAPGGIAAEAAPSSSAPVIGVAGTPPHALGYRMADGTKVAFAVVPPELDASGRTTFAEAADPKAGASWFVVPAAENYLMRRCLGGSSG